jgi:hypothetical protein
VRASRWAGPNATSYYGRPPPVPGFGQRLLRASNFVFRVPSERRAPSRRSYLSRPNAPEHTEENQDPTRPIELCTRKVIGFLHGAKRNLGSSSYFTVYPAKRES